MALAYLAYKVFGWSKEKPLTQSHWTHKGSSHFWFFAARLPSISLPLHFPSKAPVSGPSILLGPISHFPRYSLTLHSDSIPGRPNYFLLSSRYSPKETFSLSKSPSVLQESFATLMEDNINTVIALPPGKITVQRTLPPSKVSLYIV